jgi:hypothetical protein
VFGKRWGDGLCAKMTTMPRSTKSRPPEFWASGPVIEYAILPRSVPFRGQGLHFVNGKGLGRVPRLALCRDIVKKETVLAFCDHRWRIKGVSTHASTVEAKRRAERMYPGSRSYWVDLKVSAERVASYLRRTWRNQDCLFCGKYPPQVDAMWTVGRARICSGCVREFHADMPKGTKA